MAVAQGPVQVFDDPNPALTRLGRLLSPKELQLLADLVTQFKVPGHGTGHGAVRMMFYKRQVSAIVKEESYQP